MWNQHFLAVYNFFQRNTWQSSLQNFYCVFLHWFHCQNNFMWAEYLAASFSLSSLTWASCLKKRQFSAIRQFRLFILSIVAAPILCCIPDRFLKALDQGYMSCGTRTFLLLYHDKERWLFPSLAVWISKGEREEPDLEKYQELQKIKNLLTSWQLKWLVIHMVLNPVIIWNFWWTMVHFQE